MYYPGIGTIEERINDTIDEVSRSFIIKAIEHIMDKDGLYQFLRIEMKNAQSNSNADYFFTCSNGIIKEILSKYTPLAKEFEIELNSKLCNLERINLH